MFLLRDWFEINTKRYTQTRLQRILLYAILGITKKDMQLSKVTKPYVRILGFNDKGHADNEFNNRCDEMAREAISKL